MGGQGLGQRGVPRRRPSVLLFQHAVRWLSSVPGITSFGRGSRFLAMVAWVLRPELGPCLGAACHQSNFGAAFSGDSDQVTLGS